MQSKVNLKWLRRFAFWVIAVLLAVVVAVPRHKCCYEITSSRNKKVISGTLSQYAKKWLFKNEGFGYDTIPKGWGREGKVITYKATYCPLSLVLFPFPSGIWKSDIRVLDLYVGKYEKTGKFSYIIMLHTMPQMAIPVTGSDNRTVTLKYLLEKYDGDGSKGAKPPGL